MGYDAPNLSIPAATTAKGPRTVRRINEKTPALMASSMKAAAVKAQPKDPISLLGDPVRAQRQLDQLLKDHPKLTREKALAHLRAAGL